MYTLNYWNNYRDCGYCHESEDLNELLAEWNELRKQDEENSELFEDYYAQMWIDGADGLEVKPFEQFANYELS